MDAFYFTPEPVEDLAAQERAKTVIAHEVPGKELETEAIPEGQQIALLDKGEKWQEHWRGMPEYIQEDLMPWKSVLVHFEDRQSMEKFSKLVKQKINLETQYIWYPEAEIELASTKRYVTKTNES